MTPILMLGAGRMGGALIEGWRAAGAFQASDLIIREPHANPTLEAAKVAGAMVNPADGELARAATVLLAVKPQMWREAAAEIAPRPVPNAATIPISPSASPRSPRASPLGHANTGTNASGTFSLIWNAPCTSISRMTCWPAAMCSWTLALSVP